MVLKYRLNLKLSWKEKGVKRKLHCRPHLQCQDQEIGTIKLIVKLLSKFFFCLVLGPVVQTLGNNLDLLTNWQPKLNFSLFV